MEEVELNSHCRAQYNCPRKNVWDESYGPRDISLEACTIPTLGFYEKYGREHPPLSHQVGATASPPPHNVAHHQSTVIPHFLPLPTTVTVAPAAAATTVPPSLPMSPFHRRRHELPPLNTLPLKIAAFEGCCCLCCRH
jgi:hypothetical protein